MDVRDGGEGDGRSAVMGGERSACVRSRGVSEGIVAGTLELSEGSGKTSHTISHSFSNSFSISGERGGVAGFVIDIFAGADFEDLFNNFCDCGRFLKE